MLLIPSREECPSCRIWLIVRLVYEAGRGYIYDRTCPRCGYRERVKCGDREEVVK